MQGDRFFDRPLEFLDRIAATDTAREVRNVSAEGPVNRRLDDDKIFQETSPL